MMLFQVRRGDAALVLLACGACAALSLPSCQMAPVSGKVGLSPQKQAKVVAKGFTLRHYLRVTSLAAERGNGGLLNVRLGLENVRSKEIWCDIQVVFYDKDGFEAERTNWQPLHLPAREITFFKTTSLSSSVSDFSVLLRNPRRR